MINKLLPMILACWSTCFAFSQASSSMKQTKNLFTLSAGPTAYQIFGSQPDLEANYPSADPKKNTRIGFRIDLAYKRLLPHSLSLQTGLSLIQKGGSQTGTGFVDYARMEKTYLQIPLLVGAQTNSGKTRLGISTGLGMNFEVASGNSTTGFGWISKSVETHNFLPSVLVVPFLETHLNDTWVLNFRVAYEQDLQAVYKRTASDNKEYNIKMRGLSFTVGVIKAM